MRIMFLAAVAAVLLGCQQPSAPEAGELEQVAPSSTTGQSRFIVEETPEEHEGC